MHERANEQTEAEQTFAWQSLKLLALRNGSIHAWRLAFIRLDAYATYVNYTIVCQLEQEEKPWRLSFDLTGQTRDVFLSFSKLHPSSNASLLSSHKLLNYYNIDNYGSSLDICGSRKEVPLPTSWCPILSKLNKLVFTQIWIDMFLLLLLLRPFYMVCQRANELAICSYYSDVRYQLG